MVIPDSLDGLS